MECDPNLLRGNTDAILLFLIGEHGTTYGYRLIKDIHSRTGGFMNLKEGTVYPALHRLENDGLIEGEWQKLTGGQERRCYRITLKGERVLEGKMAMLESFMSAMQHIFQPAGELPT